MLAVKELGEGDPTIPPPSAHTMRGPSGVDDILHQMQSDNASMGSSQFEESMMQASGPRRRQLSLNLGV